ADRDVFARIRVNDVKRPKHLSARRAVGKKTEASGSCCLFFVDSIPLCVLQFESKRDPRVVSSPFPLCAFVPRDGIGGLLCVYCACVCKNLCSVCRSSCPHVQQCRGRNPPLPRTLWFTLGCLEFGLAREENNYQP
ncbi:unnamed protein product, partial [Scytosiphon promiscuus]